MQEVRTYSTRFQGSKKRVLGWLLGTIGLEDLPAGTIFDAFSGSGIVSYSFARAGWEVTACDQLLHCGQTLEAFIGNTADLDVDLLLEDIEAGSPGPFQFLIPEYAGIFFPEDELRWLACAANRISQLPSGEWALAGWALSQSALSKRPYNLFHRANLSMRTRDVSRSFGNKTTWEKPFPDHFRKFVGEVLKFRLPNATPPQIHIGDARKVEGAFDLVYVDPPYLDSKGKAPPYRDFYGFLDLLIKPSLFRSINPSKAHKPLTSGYDKLWDTPEGALEAFAAIFERHQESTLVLSYRDDGRPSIDELEDLLSQYKSDVEVAKVPINYALAHKTSVHETLLIGR